MRCPRRTAMPTAPRTAQPVSRCAESCVGVWTYADRMEYGDDEFQRFMAFTENERKKRKVIEGRRLRLEARTRLDEVEALIESVEIAIDGRAADVDRPFAASNVFLPSTLIRTQLRLAVHYIRAADERAAPELSSFVVLRAAIECAATAHWLLSGDSLRVRIERVLKRMWWDTQSAADMATTADGNPDLTALNDLRALMSAIAQPIKRVDVDSIASSSRQRLSGIVEDASRAARPTDPTTMHAAWMVCAAVSHGNIPVSAGAGLDAALIQNPSKHPIDGTVYASILSETVTDLRTIAELFQQYAAEGYLHRRPGTSPSDAPPHD